MTNEISKVVLIPETPLTDMETDRLLANLHEEAVKGFKVEIGREVIGHASGGSASFIVSRIEPANKFYGAVDGDTVFEIVRDEVKPPPPSVGKCELFVTPPCDESILLTEVYRLKPFMDELEALRVKHGVSWGCLRKLVEAIDQFGDETAPSI